MRAPGASGASAGRGPIRPVRGADAVDPGERLREEREELSATVQALAEKFDVGARARDAAGSARTSAAQTWDRVVRSPYFVPALAAAGAAVALAVGVRRARGRRGD